MESWEATAVQESIDKFDVSDEAGQLVFADWLEEQGQLGWANVVRIWLPSRYITSVAGKTMTLKEILGYYAIEGIYP